MSFELPELKREHPPALCVALPLPEFPDGGVWTVCDVKLLKKLIEFHRIMTTGPVGRLSNWSLFREFRFADDMFASGRDQLRSEWFVSNRAGYVNNKESRLVQAARFRGDNSGEAEFFCKLVDGASYTDFPKLNIADLLAVCGSYDETTELDDMPVLFTGDES